MSQAQWMETAFALAEEAAADGEIPVGAVIVDAGGRIIGQGRNRRESGDPLGHAEIYAIREAAQAIGDWRLDGTTMCVTLEPCAMCAGALVNARVARLVFGAFDPKAGAVASLFEIGRDERLNHRFAVEGGVLGEESVELLRAFFGSLRARGEK